VVFVRERILFPPTLLKVVIVVIGLQDNFQMNYQFDAQDKRNSQLDWGVGTLV